MKGTLVTVPQVDVYTDVDRLSSSGMSGCFTYTRLSSKSDIQDQSGHPGELQPAERLSEPPFTPLIFKLLLCCQLASPSNGTGEREGGK